MRLNDATENPESDNEQRASHFELMKASHAAVILPIAISVAALTVILILAGADAAVEVLTTAIATGTLLGKFVVLRGIHPEGFLDSPYKLAVLVLYMDLMVAFIAVYNVQLLHRLPFIGVRLARIQQNGVDILRRNPWMGKATFAGVVAFVTFPLSGTGAIGGALFGRLLGQSLVGTMIAIGVGSVIGGFGMAALTEYFGDQLKNLQDNPLLLVGGVLAVMGVLYWLFTRANHRADRE